MRPVAVIDPAMRVPELDCFNRMSRRSRAPLTYHLPALYGLASLEREGEVAGAVILGSGASVNEDHAWQDALRAWLRPRLEAGLPVLGLCYGHQLLADLFGGEVGFVHPDRTKLRGLRPVRLAANPLWGPACEGPLLETHREMVVRLPDDVEVVGVSDAIAVEALAHRRLPAWGFQAHPEATREFARNNDVPFDGPEDVLAFGHRVVDAFLDRVAGA